MPEHITNIYLSVTSKQDVASLREGIGAALNVGQFEGAFSSWELYLLQDAIAYSKEVPQKNYIFFGQSRRGDICQDLVRYFNDNPDGQLADTTFALASTSELIQTYITSQIEQGQLIEIIQQAIRDSHLASDFDTLSVESVFNGSVLTTRWENATSVTVLNEILKPALSELGATASKVTYLVIPEENGTVKPPVIGGPAGVSVQVISNSDLEFRFTVGSKLTDATIGELVCHILAQQSKTAQPNSPTRVVVFDTVHPHLDSLTNSHSFSHPLAKAFFDELAPGKRIQCQSNNPTTPPVTDLNHGIFVIGIILQLTKSCQIDLYDISDSQGQMGVSVFSTQLANLSVPSAEQRLFNLSWGIDVIPRSEYPQEYMKWEGNKQWLVAGLQPLKTYELLESLEKYDSDVANVKSQLPVGNPQVAITAAAGNDLQWLAAVVADPLIKPLPWPRYPARFPQTIGVGALDVNGNRAVYSNEPDIFSLTHVSPDTKNFATSEVGFDPTDPATWEGFYTWGGDDSWPIISLYFNDVGAATNTLGVAGWTGTSFATAIITGILARLCEEGFTAQEAYDALRQFVGPDRKILARQVGIIKP